MWDWLKAIAILVAIGLVGVWLYPGEEMKFGGAPPDAVEDPSPAVTAPTPAPTPSPIRPAGPKKGRTAAPARPAWNATEHFAEVDETLNQLVQGHIAFNTPERMQFHEAHTIALVLSPQLTADSLTSELRDRIGGSDPIAVQALAIAPLMEAKLEGSPAFEVKALTDARQPVGQSAPTEWRWDVRPEEEGKQTLHLTMNALITVDGERFSRSLKVLDREIDVNITLMQRGQRFVSGNWQWLAGTVLIPLGVWWWNRGPKDPDTGTRQRRFRRKTHTVNQLNR